MENILRRNPIGVFTVVYPGAERFLDAYFRSLSEQTRGDFDVFIVNDGMKGADAFARKYSNLSILETELKGSPVKIRERGLNAMAQLGYEDVVFADADDYFDNRRIERTTGHLRTIPIVVNELRIVDTLSSHVDSGYLSRRFSPQSFIDADDLVDMNLCGFSNTSIKGSLLDGDAKFDERLVALDWYFFASLLTRKVRALFVDDTHTYYRRHSDNTASFTDIGEEKVLNGVKVKTAHYRAMAQHGERYARLCDEYEMLGKRLDRDPDFKGHYVKWVRDNMPKNALWWEPMRMPKEMGL